MCHQAKSDGVSPSLLDMFLSGELPTDEKEGDASAMDRNEKVQHILGFMKKMEMGNSLSDSPVEFEEDVTCGCQGCGNSYNDEDVMIVDGVGPLCMRCLHNAAYYLFNGDTGHFSIEV